MNNAKASAEEKRKLFEAYLAEQPRGEQDLLRESMAYSLLAGGKRLRPVLFLLTAEMYGHELSSLLPFAAGIEMIHTYSLIHDDLPAMDNDDYRRGRLTNHKVYGDAQAILAGDGLLTEAFYQMTSLKATEDPAALLDAIQVVADFAGINGMVRGQTSDILNENKKLSIADLQAIHNDKTGALLCLGPVTAGILCHAPAEDIDALQKYGRYLGLAFQITDDILDATGNFADLGKPVGSDADNQKSTYITLLGLDGAEKAAAEAAELAKAQLKRLSVDAAVLTEILETVIDRKK